MKLFMFISLSLIVGCASPSVQKTNRVSLENLRSLAVGKTSEKEFTDILGYSNDRSEKGGYYTLNYYDQETQAQRISANFSKDSKTLMGYIWIPAEGEKEITLEGAKTRFQKVEFKEEVVPKGDGHSQTEITIYKDVKSGTLIRYNKTYRLVEAIGMYDVNSRVPATAPKSH